MDREEKNISVSIIETEFKELQNYIYKVVGNIIGERIEVLKSEYDLKSGGYSSLDLKDYIKDELFIRNHIIINIDIKGENNKIYIFRILLRGQYETNRPLFREININNEDRYERGEFMYISSLKEDKLDIKHPIYDYMIYDINLNYLKSLSVEKLNDDSTEKLLYFLICDSNQRDLLYKEDESMKEVLNKIKRLKEESIDSLKEKIEEHKKRAQALSKILEEELKNMKN